MKQGHQVTARAVYGFSGEYAWLSNGYELPVRFEGELLPSAEHAYAVAKATTPAQRMGVRAAAGPRDAWLYGRHNVTLPPHWEAIRVDRMASVLRAKFAAPSLAEALKATDGLYLEHTVFRADDTFWGVYGHYGSNVLGRLLMGLRASLLDSRQPLVLSAVMPAGFRASDRAPGGPVPRRQA